MTTAYCGLSTLTLLVAIGCPSRAAGAQASRPAKPQRPAKVEKQLVLEGFEEAGTIPGLLHDTKLAKVGRASGRWAAMDRTPAVSLRRIPHDWSGYNAVCFWLHNDKRLAGTRFMMIVRSESPATEGPDYYAARIDLGRWAGWKRFLIPFREMGRARSPRGWDRIDRIDFTAGGWGNTPNPRAVVRFDDLRLVRIPRVFGPRLTDEELFAAMNLEYPGLAGVKAAVAKGDYAAAKAAWLAHLRVRKRPRWHLDWRDRPKRPARPPVGGSPGWDYYCRKIAVDWTGWKKLTLKKADFGKTRKPIGWHWITYISLSAGGWGLTPDANTTLYFDDVRLVGKDGATTLSDFEAGLGDWAGLAHSDEHAKSGKYSGKWQHMHVHTSIRLRKVPTDWSDVEALELWCYSPKATGAKVILVLNSDQSAVSRADEILRHVIQGHDFGPDIDWSADPNNYREWTYSLNRFYHWRTLCEAYWQTGREKYAREFCNQLADWARKNPVPLFTSGNGSYTWRTIECGIRQSTTWPDCLHRVLGSEPFTPDAAATMTQSMVEHARHLMKWFSRGSNWITMESNGLGTIGILLPEFREAAEWRDTALGRMHRELTDQVYPDGAQIELTTGYHQVSLRNFLGLARTAKLNDVPLPADYYAKLRRMFEYNLYVQMPDGRTPALNDGGMGSILSSMATAYELYEAPLFQWAATRGAKGTGPKHTSYFFPYAGQMVMRSGWQADAHYLLMDAGPFGAGHQHEDKLSIVVHALGKLHVLDPGNYHYDASDWRRYTIDTAAHNTILVDGLPQRRRGRPRREYVVKEPSATNVWLTSGKLDYAAGQYDQGYGSPKRVRVVHRREIVFIKPAYWLVVDTLTGGDRQKHRFESLFHFDADEAEIDAGSPTVRTIDPSPNCLIAAAPQPGLKVGIVKGRTQPTLQGFVAAQKWRPSWKDPKAKPPEHGKREIPTAVFDLRSATPAHLVYVIYPHAQGRKPRVGVKDLTRAAGPVRVQVTLPDETVDEITVGNGARVVRAAKGSVPKLWAEVRK